MTLKKTKTEPANVARTVKDREERVAAALRANLQKRKMQQRARDEEPQDK